MVFLQIRRHPGRRLMGLPSSGGSAVCWRTEVPPWSHLGSALGDDGSHCLVILLPAHLQLVLGPGGALPWSGLSSSQLVSPEPHWKATCIPGKVTRQLTCSAQPLFT